MKNLNSFRFRSLDTRSANKDPSHVLPIYLHRSPLFAPHIHTPPTISPHKKIIDVSETHIILSSEVYSSSLNRLRSGFTPIIWFYLHEVLILEMFPIYSVYIKYHKAIKALKSNLIFNEPSQWQKHATAPSSIPHYFPINATYSYSLPLSPTLLSWYRYILVV